LAPSTAWSTVGKIEDRPSLSGVTSVARKITATAQKMGGRTASSVLDFGGPSGSSLPSILATSSPLSTFQYQLSRADRLALYRYFQRTDPFVGRAIELHSELPMSRLSIGPPKGPNLRQNKLINRIYENMTERLGIMPFLLEVSREYWSAGDIYIWHEWDDEILEWKDVYILPCEYCHSVLHPFNRKREIIFFARPLVDTAAIRRMTDRDLYLVADAEIERLYEDLGDDVPPELRDALNYGEAVPLNTNPAKGSYVLHISRNRAPNEEYGSSVIERCLETLFRLENLKNAQMNISSRNMTPKHLICAEGIGEGQLADLRNQVDLSLLEKGDYPIVTNYPVDWKTVGANDRLLAVGEEYSTLREDLATGLGTTKEMLTGQASYGSQRITLEMMNTQYLTFREVMRIYVEEGLFRPVAEKKGHYYREELDMWVRIEPSELNEDEVFIQESDGSVRKRMIQVQKIWNHSTLRFNRLSVRDNTEVYDQLFQLHQKGSLAVRYLLDLHNIDPEENAVALLEDLGTVKDSTFNDLLRSVYSAAGQPILENTNFLDKIVEGLKLKVKKQPASGGAGGGLGGAPGGSMPMGGDAGGGMDLGDPMGGDPGGNPDMATPIAPTGDSAMSPEPPAIDGTAKPLATKRRLEIPETLGQRLSTKDVRKLMKAHSEAGRNGLTARDMKKVLRRVKPGSKRSKKVGV
jgi:hypothetical protein